MVLSSNDALALTTNSLIKNSAADLQTEISLAEARIRSATGVGLYNTVYNATIIGNPQVDPRTTEDMPPNQQMFFEIFTEAGYVVSADPATGYWSLSWSPAGAETMVGVYSFRTTFDPTEITTTTMMLINGFFEMQRPTIHSTVSYNGYIDEAGFGGVSSPFYEFTIVVDQQQPDNYSAALKAHLVVQGLGYTSENCNVYRTG